MALSRKRNDYVACTRIGQRFADFVSVLSDAGCVLPSGQEEAMPRGLLILALLGCSASSEMPVDAGTDAAVDDHVARVDGRDWLWACSCDWDYPDLGKGEWTENMIELNKFDIPGGLCRADDPTENVTDSFCDPVGECICACRILYGC